MTTTKNDPKVIKAWAMYDWANSVFALVITSTIFPIYYDAITKSKEKMDMVNFLGFEVKNSVLFSYTISISFLIIAFINPILTAMADYSGKKKAFMQFFCYLGAAACAGLYFFDTEHISLGIVFFSLGLIGFSGSLVFYNSYLPEITDDENIDVVSAKGFTLGYIGSVILLVFLLAVITFHKELGFENAGVVTKISFVLTGIWWAGFAQIPFRGLPNNVYAKSGQGSWVLNGFKELIKVFKQVLKRKLLLIFLLAFFFYNAGAQTVMYVATIFGTSVLHLKSEQLILTILILQIVAIGGAYIFSFLSKKFGNIRALSIAIFVWIGICGWAHYVEASDFYYLAATVGLVMGGIQSLSRSTYAKLMPETEDTASYFSLYDFCDKISLVIGPAIYGLIEQRTSARDSVLALMVFFMIGFVIILFIPSRNSYEK